GQPHHRELFRSGSRRPCQPPHCSGAPPNVHIKCHSLLTFDMSIKIDRYCRTASGISRRAMKDGQVVVIGAGMAGLTAALAMATRGIDVTIVEREQRPGGKMREVVVGQRPIDSGPTVLTMRWVFDELFGELGERLEDHIGLQPLQV